MTSQIRSVCAFGLGLGYRGCSSFVNILSTNVTIAGIDCCPYAVDLARVVTRARRDVTQRKVWEDPDNKNVGVNYLLIEFCVYSVGFGDVIHRTNS